MTLETMIYIFAGVSVLTAAAIITSCFFAGSARPQQKDEYEDWRGI